MALDPPFPAAFFSKGKVPAFLLIHEEASVQGPNGAVLDADPALFITWAFRHQRIGHKFYIRYNRPQPNHVPVFGRNQQRVLADYAQTGLTGCIL